MVLFRWAGAVLGQVVRIVEGAEKVRGKRVRFSACARVCVFVSHVGMKGKEDVPATVEAVEVLLPQMRQHGVQPSQHFLELGQFERLV